MVAIKDFEMPKKCIWDCPLCNGEGGACQLSDVKTSGVKRPSDCPLVEAIPNAMYKCAEKAIETREEFIFETIKPYCEELTQQKISKEELKDALSLWISVRRKPIHTWSVDLDKKEGECSNCHARCGLVYGVKYCPNCGLPVKYVQRENTNCCNGDCKNCINHGVCDYEH